MTATYTFTVEGATYTSVLVEARKVAKAYWCAIPYRITDVNTGTEYSVVTTELEQVAG